MNGIWRRCRTLFSQFPFFTAARLVAFDILRKLLDPFCLVSYSQTGEDRIIDYYLGQCDSTYYVDIGCHQPFAMSNTLRLYRNGWRGLCVDGNSDLVASFQKFRPRDICVCACVSDRETIASFVIPEATAMSTLSQEFEDERLRGDVKKTRISVNTVTAQSLFQTYGVPSTFGLLTIDVEGHDFEVLSAIDLNAYRPRLIVVEMHQLRLGTEEVEGQRIIQYLRRYQYEMVAYATMNGYFMRRDQHVIN